MGEELFDPSKITDIDALEPWQAIVAATHFGPAMGDCVTLGYTYSFDGETIFCHWKDDVFSLDGDISMDDPIAALEQYAGVENVAVNLAKRLLRERSNQWGAKEND